MTRKRSYQRGSIEFRNGVATLRYWHYEHDTGEWTHPRVKLGKFKDKKAARNAAEPIMAKVNERNNTKPGKLHAALTFAEFHKAYWKPYEVSNEHEPTTIDLRDSLYKTHLQPEFGEMEMRDIKPFHVSDFLDVKREAGYSNSTLRVFYRFLKVFFELAFQFDVVKKSPVRPKRHSPKSAKIHKPTLTAEQIREVLSRLENSQEWLAVLLLAVTGLRVNEGLALCVSDFNEPESLLSINHTLYKGRLKSLKTEGSKAKMKLDKRLSEMLAKHIATARFHSPRDFIFHRADGSPLAVRQFREHLQTALKAIGVKIEPYKHGFHIMRHSAATILKQLLGDLSAVQEFLRHTEAETTKIYVHEEAPAIEGSSLILEQILPIRTPAVPNNLRKVG